MDHLHVVSYNLKFSRPAIFMVFIVTLGISCNLVSSKNIKSETCSQVGKPERNVTLMYGMHHKNVQINLIGHVGTLKECVELACRRENTSLAYTSRFDCYSVVCKGDEELCWFLPSFHNPTLVFARLERKVNDASLERTDKNSKKKGKKQR
ncbi:uncharacterized protein LOC110242303 [Exaiptasia diaphana]|uniref:Uncharacterized protein n=1 Tax=Exaiptasia diaphana TaxID=2652724 RepID=A0A913XG82_EXADI|nr:uncharacterized protein LOC110242303 [Exaiptasia diaphana]KXJ12341.1 hypothetical protein AC249_AIPGENE12705 [Exaiptasia diaphana]